MPGMIEVAQATVTIIPTMQGAQQTITKEMTGAGEAAGTAAGKVAGNSMASSFGSTMSKAGGSLTKGVTLPLAAVGAASVAAWKEVDAGLDTIIQKTGASGEALESMGDILNNITANIPTDFATAGAAIGEVNTRFGVTGQELETLSGQFIKFAALNDQDVSSSVDNVSKVLAAFGMEASDAGTMLDALNTVGQQTGVDVGSLAQLLSANASSFREMGLSAEEAASFMGAADMAGIDATQMVMGLRTAMKSAAKDGTSLDTVIAQFSETMSSNASESDKLAAAYELFGSRAGASIYNAVQNGTLDLANFTSSLGDFEGSVSETFEGTLDPMDQFTTIMNQLKSVGADLVTAMGPALVDVLGTVAGVVGTLADAWGKLSPETQSFIVTMGLLAAAAGPVLSVGGKAVSGIEKISGGISALSGKLSGATSSLGSFGSSASSAASGASAAGSSFAQMGGQALLLVAAGAAILLIAGGIKILSDAAIALAQEGPGAVAVLVLLAGVAVGMTAAIVAIGSAATVSAVGLLAMGAAVLMISAGVSILVLSLTVFCGQLPTIAEYGGSAALALVELAGGMTLMAAGAALLTVALSSLLLPMGLYAVELLALITTTGLFSAAIVLGTASVVALTAVLVLATGAVTLQTAAVIAATAAMTLYSGQTLIATAGGTAFAAVVALATVAVLACTVGITAGTVANAAWTVTIVAAEVAMIALLAELLLLDAELVIMAGALVLVNGQMSGIAESARSAASDMEYMVMAVDVVDQFLNTLKDTASDVLGFVVDLFSKDAQAMNTTGIATMTSLTNTVTSGTNNIKTTWSTALTAMALATTTGSVKINATWISLFTSLNSTTRGQMTSLKSTIQSTLNEIQRTFANTRLSFNQRIKLPHFSMSGSFDAKSGRVPSVNVSWYKDAATQGARFSSPTIIGVGDATQPELLIGETTLFQQIREATGETGDTIIPVYLGGDLLDTLVVKANQRNNYRSGGRA